MADCARAPCENRADQLVRFSDGTERAFCSGCVADLDTIDYLDFRLVRNL